MSHVFISYSHEDSQRAFQIQEDFEKKGFATWIDEKIDNGDRWWTSIKNAIKGCAAFIVVMTPRAEESGWVEKEIMLAFKYNKRVYGLLLDGEEFDILINIQCHPLQKSNGFLPSLDFYQDLARYVPRKPVKWEPSKLSVPKIPKTKSLQNYVINLNDWDQHAISGRNDFFGLAMLSLAYEERGMRQRAIFFFRKARKIEPRLVDLEWMIEHYHWDEVHCRLAKELLSDSKFWDSNLNG